jgi:hypothetical protein
MSEVLKSTYEECQCLFDYFFCTTLLNERKNAFNQVGIKSERPLVDSKQSDAFWEKLRLYIDESMRKKDLTSLCEIKEVMKNDPILSEKINSRLTEK